jgi:MFS family permease
MQRPAHILVIIIVSQFAGTSLWFAGNAILPELQSTFHLDKHAVSSITSAVQFGFISGTFVFAFLSIADRLSPSFVFFVSSVLASTTNWLVLYVHDVNLLFSLRFLTGFFLAGIYPVGMKIAADWYEKDLGKALGYLVGALVVGTAFPHLLKGDLSLPWKSVITTTSLFALAGGIIILLFVADGPSRRKAGQFQPGRLFHAFTIPRFRAAAFGYFGHMWELYTVWAFLPSIIMLHNKLVPPPLNIPLSSFFAIAAGAVGCVVGGWLSKRIGSKRVAFYSLAFSGCCCIISPWMIASSNISFVTFIILWGIAVAADSPQFSALVASAAPAQEKGTALTIVISIGFAITIVSLYVTDQLYHRFVDSTNIYALLFIGPVLGLLLMAPLLRNNQSKVLKPAA